MKKTILLSALALTVGTPALAHSCQWYVYDPYDRENYGAEILSIWLENNSKKVFENLDEFEKVFLEDLEIIWRENYPNSTQLYFVDTIENFVEKKPTDNETLVKYRLHYGYFLEEFENNNQKFVKIHCYEYTGYYIDESTIELQINSKNIEVFESDIVIANWEK